MKLDSVQPITSALRAVAISLAALGLLCCLAPLARAASLPAVLPATLPASISLPISASAGLSVAQMGDEHEGEGFEVNTDPGANLAVPVLMIVAGLLYLVFARWQARRRAHRAAHPAAQPGSGGTPAGSR